MRHLFLILMIALLPLRGWVGDAMAMDTAAQSMNTIESVATYAHPTGARGQFDGKNEALTHAECPGHVTPASGVAADSTGATNLAGDGDGSASGHCNTCGVCQICHTVALTQAMALYPPGFIPHVLPAMGSTRFVSAVAALSQKPPIS